MSPAEIVRHIREVAPTGEFAEVGISGGEPFLFPGDLHTIVAGAHDVGLTSSVTTNGFWGVTPDAAARALRPLVSRGLAAVSISVSRFHLEYANTGRLLNAAGAALDAGLEVRVNVVRSRTFGVTDAHRLFGDLSRRLTFVTMPLIPAGRAARETETENLPAQPGGFGGSCAEFFTKVAVTPNGDVYPCCSPGGFTPPLRAGNVGEESLPTIIEKMRSSTLHRVLKGVGPAFFVPFIGARLQRDLATEPFVDQCHLCQTIMSDAAMRAVVNDALQQLESELGELGITFEELERESHPATG
ncbi:MoaA/NifB/PqqE/SkfB family radical SAM enzyme [Actinopolymorpha cephalotaxi]|nr:MoaA/NifB/PqqE/SkfB family radical SAM enzyme [Actinopolymorpha cephalotaxi]